MNSKFILVMNTYWFKVFLNKTFKIILKYFQKPHIFEAKFLIHFDYLFNDFDVIIQKNIKDIV